MNMKTSLASNSLNGCGYVVVPVMAYLATLYRNKILEKWRNPLVVQMQDYHTYRQIQVVLPFVRIFVLSILVIPFLIPVILLSEKLGDDVAVLFVCYVIPSILGALVVYCGPYEVLTHKIYSKCM